MVTDPWTCRRCGEHDTCGPCDERAEGRKDGDSDPFGWLADHAQTRWERDR